MPVTKIVKRYANRKLYDTERSCYVTLEDIALMIKTGDEIKVIDNKSGEDLTSVTLAQIIFETEKKKNFMPLSLLRDLIQGSSGTLGDLARGGVEQVAAKAQEVKDSASKIKLELGNRLERVCQSDEVEQTGKTETTMYPTVVRDLLGASKNAFEELQKNVEDKIKGPVGAVARYATVGRDMEEIRRRMNELEHRLEQFPQ